MNEKHDFTEGPIAKKMLGFATPVFFAMFLQIAYGAVDMLIVGWFGTKTDVAAVSTGSWIIWTVIAVLLGLASGITTIVGQKIGEKNYDTAITTIITSLGFFLFLSIFVTIAMELAAPHLTTFMQTPAEAVQGTLNYTRICSAGFLFTTAYASLGSIFRGLGDSKTPLITVSIACCVNIVGDLIMAGYYHIPVEGSAYATIFAQGISVLLTFLMVLKKKLSFEYNKSALKFDRHFLLPVLKVGVPIALQDFLVTLSFLVVTAIVNSLGVTFSAAAGVAERVCGLIMLVPMTLAQTVAVFVAQNSGAQKPDRAKKALYYGIGISLCMGIFLGWLSFFHGDILVTPFARGKTDVILASADYLRAYAIDCLFTSFMFCLEGYFVGYGKTRFVLFQGMIGAFCVRIPISYFMSKTEPVSLFKIALATPASTLVQIVLFSCYFIYFNRTAKKQ